MNPVQDTKQWQQAQLQNTSVDHSSQQPQPLQHYQPVPTMEHTPFPQSGPMHPPMHQTTAGPSFLPLGKPDSEARLPGMMALSQPGTPRPIPGDSPQSPTGDKRASGYTFHSLPYPPTMLAARKRGRSDHTLFSPETGPVFSSTKTCENLYALDRSTLLNVRIQSKFDRGFFLADNDWTCYRRNYFQVSSAFSIHGLPATATHYYGGGGGPDQWQQCLVHVDGTFRPVQRFLLGISARVSNSDKKIELVQHTPKRDKGPQTTPMPRPITPGGNLSMSTVGTNNNIVTFERIQFKTATANNGKRRAAQQYYVCIIDLYAEIDGGQQVKIATCQSAPLVVRGRSPGHYSDSHERYEMPMSAAAATAGAVAAPPPPPPPPPPTASSSQQQQQQQQPQQPASSHSVDDRFHMSFSRPPITPPSMMPGEYGSAYPYYHPGFASMSVMPPTPTGPPPSAPHHHHPPPVSTTATSTTSTVPTYQQQHPYMVPSMSSDPSSSESSSPDMYTGEFNPPTPAMPEGGNKLHHGLSHAQHHPGLIDPSATVAAAADWTRSRYSSASSAGHSPHYMAQGPPTPVLPSPSSQQAPYSSPPYRSKYNAVPNIVNQQS